MKVFKFGGASVREANGIRNLASIVEKERDNLVIVISAFGKTTNALEIMLKSWTAGDKTYLDHFDAVRLYHQSIAEELSGKGCRSMELSDKYFNELSRFLSTSTPGNFDHDYDQVVSYGELWSTIIVNTYLNEVGITAGWIDIRDSLLTDERFRDANVLWEDSIKRIKQVFDFAGNARYVTQGFIGGSKGGKVTTLGREGSDFTAAIIANILDAESVTVWKDVPGLLNADPKWLPGTVKLGEVSYREAVEMTFSGAKVIHPKTIKPLHNKNIPMYVKSFLNPGDEGTLITSDPNITKIHPVFIRKENQVLLSLLPRDLSFVIGDNLSRMFAVFYENGIRVNLVEASAVSIDVCVDDDRPKIEQLLLSLKNDYSALYNDEVELLTIRHSNREAFERISSGREILLEQSTRNTVRIVVRKM